jgi:uncharacterized tellurite resistance protein B-like protein
MILPQGSIINSQIMQTQSETILKGYSEREKAAYLVALTSLATADRRASEEELEQIREMSHAAGLSPEQEQLVLHSAEDVSGEDLTKALDVLKNSELRFSLVADLIALAKADDSYTTEEKTNIEKIARYLKVEQSQFSVLDQFVDRAAEKAESPQDVTRHGFFDSLGMGDKFSNAGLNMGSVGKGLLGFLGPMILGSLAGRALGGRRSGMGGGLGGSLGGGMLGGALGGMLGGNSRGGGMGLPGGLGGFGSIISGLNRSRGNQSMGGLLGRLLR